MKKFALQVKSAEKWRTVMTGDDKDYLIIVSSRHFTRYKTHRIITQK